MPIKSERVELRLDSEILDRIDEWRSKQEGFPSRAEAMRRLMRTGMDDQNSRRMFDLTKFQVLWSAITNPNLWPAAYVFAWDRGVYPSLHDETSLHSSYEHFFRVSEKMLSDLSRFLDDLWLERKTITFYGLEDHFRVRSSDTPWDRSKLLAACRYLVLDDRFDRDFWNGVIEQYEHPVEASYLLSEFDVARDIHLI